MALAIPSAHLITATRAELTAAVVALGERPYRAQQIHQWVHRHGVTRFAGMGNVPLGLREALASQLEQGSLTLLEARLSVDGTQKLVFETADGGRIESVLIPMRHQYTQCISSQIGCTLTCTFCQTGRMGLGRNLHAAEMVEQVILARQHLQTNRAAGLTKDAAPHGGADTSSMGAEVAGDDWMDYGAEDAGDVPVGAVQAEPVTDDAAEAVSHGQADRLGNLVFMGMGEPLANYKHLIQAVRTLQDPEGLNFSHRRVTVSTAGLVSAIGKLGQDVRVNLAVSLNATTDVVRSQLMPINAHYPLESLMQACRQFPLAPRRRITFEYCLLKGINDTDADADRIALLLKGLRAKVNVLAFNEYPGAPFERPAQAVVDRFCQRLFSHHVVVTFRESRGRDIGAACGQLGKTPEHR